MSLLEPVHAPLARDSVGLDDGIALERQARDFFNRAPARDRETSILRKTRLAVAMVLVDLAAVALGFLAAIVIADSLRLVLGVDQVSTSGFLDARAREMVLLAALTIGVFAFGGLYRRASWELDEIRRVFAGVALVAMFDATLQFVLRDHDSRLWFLVAYPLIAISVISLRMALRATPAMRTAMTSHIVLLGTGVAPDRLMYQFRGSRSGPVKLLRALPLARVVNRSPEVLDQMIDRLAYHAGVPAHRLQIVLAPTPGEMVETQETIALLNAVQRPYGIVLPFRGLARSGLGLQKVIGADMVMAEMQATAPSLIMRTLKRLFDLIAASLVTLALSPVLAGLMVLLSFERGPVFFSQSRVGRGGKRFRCLKFRTMRPDAEERLKDMLASDPAVRAEWDKFQKLEHDPRVTPIGDFLRKTSLDELPQLFNVIWGDMSLVGPRPIVAPEVPGYPGDRAYAEHADFSYYTSCVPGITGLWQVLGRASTSHDERVRLDRWYARNWNFWLDVVILFKTFREVLSRTGSR